MADAAPIAVGDTVTALLERPADSPPLRITGPVEAIDLDGGRVQVQTGMGSLMWLPLASVYKP